MKKALFVFAAVMMFGVSSVQAAGGAVPCLATCFFGDPRIGLYMNEGKNIETDDWIVLGLNAFTGLGPFYAGYKAYETSKNTTGFCVGYIWGRRAGSEINTTKLRTKEILMCVPVLNIYPCVSIPLEAFGGKTMSQVIEAEGLKK